ncbi:MAG TPA: cupin domain-containing protein [Geobacteraceae bacterium]
MLAADYWISALNLVRHPEGGYYRETYRSAETISGTALPGRFGGDRAFATAIYFLLSGDDFSALHRIKADELWHFHTGSPLTVHRISAEGAYDRLRLGSDPLRGEAFQGTVAAGTWFGASIDEPAGYALVSCTVAPGFDFADFALGRRADLLHAFPHLRGVIERLTRA